jgi:transposase
MIQIAPQMRILLARAPVDFRKGIDGLAALCRQSLQIDPMTGVVMVFCSRSRRALQVLVYDGQGYWLCQKRLSQGRFTGWPESVDGATARLDPHQLHLLLWNGDPSGGQTAPMWRAVSPGG